MITSTKNRRIVGAAKLKKRAFRDGEARFLVEGAQVTAEALEAEALEVLFHLMDEHGRVEPVVERARAAGTETEAVTEQVIRHLTQTVTPQGVVGVARYVHRPLAEVPDPELVPVLCAVRDPGNAGTILRSADAAGADAVVFTEGSVDCYNEKTVRASAGSLFHLPVVRGVAAEQAVAELRDRGLQVLAADARGEESLYDTDLSGPTAVLFGNEAWGLERSTLDLADRVVRVPIRGAAESLNLAAAAAVVLFEAARAREGGRGDGLDRVAALIGKAGHDIRSPLTALTGFITTLARGWDRFEEDQRREIVQGMVLDGQRVNALVRLVVDAIRVLAGAQLPGVVAERVQAEAAAAWLAELFDASPDFPDLTVEGAAGVRMDVDRLRSFLLALADGALWWGTEGPVRIALSEEAGTARIRVSRSGGGPDPEQAAEMFADPERGGRVGLYAARLVARRLGGDVAVEAGDGVSLELRFPT